MSKCRDLDPLFAPYADGEAQGGDRVSVESHLEKCPPCRERVAEQQAIHTVLASHRPSLRVSASEALRARCAAQASARSAPSVIPKSESVRPRLSRWVPLSLAATLLLAVAGAFIIGVNDTVEALAAQLTIDHVKCFQFAPERLQHTDATTAARDWAEKQGWAIDIPASSSTARLELLGVRRCATTTNGRVAHVMYTWRGQPLSMFVVPRTFHDISEQQEFIEKFGHEAVIWNGRDRTYVLLARGQPSELAPVVHYVRNYAR